MLQPTQGGDCKPWPLWLQNTLAFYSMSQPDKVQQLEYLSLLVNVNNPQEAKGAYAALLPAATTLSVQVLGEIPKGLDVEAGGSNPLTPTRTP